MSLVLPADVAGPARLKHIGRMTLLRLVLGIAGLALGAILAACEAWLSRDWLIPQWLTMSLAMVCSGGGIALLFASVFCVPWSVRNYLWASATTPSGG